MSQKYNDYLQTDYWKAVSEATKKRDGYRCRLCNSQHDLQAHHRCYDHRGRELDFLEDLTTLCRRCHGIFHGTIQFSPPPTPAPAKVTLGSLRTVFVSDPAKSEAKMKRRLAGIDHEAVARDMPEGEGDIVLTKALIDRCRNAAYAFTNAAVRPLGVQTPLVSGWARELRGKVVTRAAYRDALQGRYVYNSGPLPRKS